MSELEQQGAAVVKQWQEINQQVSEALRGIGEAFRRMSETLTAAGAEPSGIDYDAIARREWPHVPMSLARTYACEYVRTGQKP